MYMPTICSWDSSGAELDIKLLETIPGIHCLLVNLSSGRKSKTALYLDESPMIDFQMWSCRDRCFSDYSQILRMKDSLQNMGLFALDSTISNLAITLYKSYGHDQAKLQFIWIDGVIYCLIAVIICPLKKQFSNSDAGGHAELGWCDSRRWLCRIARLIW